MDLPTARIENWSVVTSDLYAAPELIRQRIHGNIIGDTKGRYPDGYVITTSSIVDVIGTTVITKTGSRYVLGEPNPDYVEWCKVNNVHVPVPGEPIKLL